MQHQATNVISMLHNRMAEKYFDMCVSPVIFCTVCSPCKRQCRIQTTNVSSHIRQFVHLCRRRYRCRGRCRRWAPQPPAPPPSCRSPPARRQSASAPAPAAARPVARQGRSKAAGGESVGTWLRQGWGVVALRLGYYGWERMLGQSWSMVKSLLDWEWTIVELLLL